MARNLTPAERRALLQALHEADRDYYPYAPDRNPGGLIGTLAIIVVALAVVSVTVLAIRTGLAQRILFPPAPLVVPSAQPTAAITVPTPRPFPARTSALNPLPPYVPQPQATPAPAPVVSAEQPPAPQVVPTQAPIIIYATPVVQPTIEGTNGWYGGYAGHWEGAQADTGAVLDVDRAPPETESKPVNLPAGQPTATAIPAKEWKCGNAPCPEPTPSGWGGGSGSGW